jgi:hypothetical protein
MWKKCITVAFNFALICGLTFAILYLSEWKNISEEPEVTIEEESLERVGLIVETETTTTMPPEKIVDVPLDATTQRWLFNECESRNVDFFIIIAMIEIESNYNENAVNDNGTCIGYMQLNPNYHSHGMNIEAPLSNLLAGVITMQNLLEHSGYDYTWSLNAYNGGGAYADGVGETYYSSKVIERAEVLKNG